jgi:hypothetical protein
VDDKRNDMGAASPDSYPSKSAPCSPHRLRRQQLLTYGKRSGQPAWEAVRVVFCDAELTGGSRCGPSVGWPKPSRHSMTP